MKKLVFTGLLGLLCRYQSILVIFTLFIANIGFAQSGCIMTCPPMEPPVEISLSAACEDELTYQLIGVTLTNCSGDVVVDILDNGISIGDTIRAEMIGHTYMVIISIPSENQSCMAMITVVDKQAPIVTCPDDVTLTCTADLEEYNPLLPEDISDCSTTQVYIDDQLVFAGQCMGSYISQYQRSYIVVDAYNNADTCQQNIYLQKASLGDVVFPDDLSGLNALSCFPLPDTTPAFTGYPTVNGDEIINGSFCNLSAIYSNQIGVLCSGGYKIFRTWTVYDWCDNNQSTSVMQIIEVLDTTAPIVEAPEDMTVSTGPSNCTANVQIPPALITEDCATTITVRMEGPFGTIHSNGGLMAGLPKGVHRIIFKANNDCGSEGSDTMYVTVQDLVPPSPVCRQHLAIPVNNFGTSLVPASVFNGGSVDNCGPVYVKARRMTAPTGDDCFNPGNPNNWFDDHIQLCCEDIANNNIMIIMRVYDVQPVSGPVSETYLAGHYNDCMVEVEVQDKLPPQIICPTDLTISCEFPFTENNLDVFGSVALTEATREEICIDDPGAEEGPGLQCIGLDGLASDNCTVSIEELEPVISINNCGVGSIIRTFVATDDGGLQASCQQEITIVNFDLFNYNDILWPEDYTTYDICEISLLDPEDLEAPYNQPTLSNGPCDMVGATYEDDVFDFSNSDQACFKILRTWTVMDWCQLNTETGGIWSRIQTIKVMNSVGPTIEPIADLDECSYDTDCGGITIDFEASAEDDCSGPASISWRYYVDLNDDASFDYTSGIILGEEIQFSRYMPIGSHRVVYSVWDKCGNITTDEQYVTIRSCTPPSVKCIHGLSTSLMPVDANGDGESDWGMVTVLANMFDAGSSHPCGTPYSLAFSSDPLDNSRVFECVPLGEIEVEVWAIDANGLTDFCVTTIDIQDNQGVCPPLGGSTGVISGNITVPHAGTLSGAMIYLDGSNLAGIPSGMNGHFVFPTMPLGGEYVVRPVREGDARNGVSTLDLVKIQKHLLGIESFLTPYQYIAADVNNSKSITAIDIIQLRKLILGIYNEFPSNKSWRFVDKGHVFPDPLNPWISNWPETYSIIPFNNNMNDVDFDAVKIGDLNLSASLAATSGMILPRGSNRCEVEYIVQPMSDKNIYQVDVYLRDADDYNGIQFSFNWDQYDFKVLDWSPGDLLTRDEFRMPDTTGQNASIAAFSVDGWQEGKLKLVTLWVEQINSIGYPFELMLSPNPTQPLAFTIAGELEVPVQIVTNQQREVMVQNRPNPFADMTTIVMESDREEPATLRVFDLGGKLILTRKVNLVVGENEFVVRKSELHTSGLLMYEIESNFQYSTNRMIIVD